MAAYDWSTFTKRITIKAKTQEVYKAWSTQSGLEKWFLRTAEFTKPDLSHRGKDYLVKKGDTYEWRWHGYTDAVLERGKILDANDKDLLQFTFSGNCIVTVRLSIAGGESLVELTQDAIGMDEDSRVNYHIGCMSGWIFYLANLKSILEGGIDLRNKDESLTNVVNA